MKGLYLLVRTNGAKLFRYDYRLNGTRRTFSIGEYGEGKDQFTLTQARDAHQEARDAVAKGNHPVGKKLAAQLAAELAAVEVAARRTVKQAAEGWKDHINKKPRAEKTRDRDERMVNYIVDAFGELGLDEVKARHLVALLDTFENAESYETRARLQSTALNIMGFAHGKAWIDSNPFLGFSFGKAFTAPQNRPRPALVDPEEFGQLLRDIAIYRGRQRNLVGRALQLLALTFVRPGTLLQVEWDEIDFDKALWTIPFAKLKQRAFRESIKELNGMPHFVPLSRQTLALLRELRQITGNQNYLFPCARSERTVSTNALELALNSLGYKDVHCPHGFRSSASTLLNRERVIVEGNEVPRFAEQAIEFQLEHVDATVAAIYNRDQRLKERTTIMQHWADKIDELRATRDRLALRVVA